MLPYCTESHNIRSGGIPILLFHLPQDMPHEPVSLNVLKQGAQSLQILKCKHQFVYLLPYQLFQFNNFTIMYLVAGYLKTDHSSFSLPALSACSSGIYMKAIY